MRHIFLSLLCVLALACGASDGEGAHVVVPGSSGPPIASVPANRSNQNRQRSRPPPVDVPISTESGFERVRVSADGAPRMGATSPLVTIVTFSDFECPFCSRVIPTLARLMNEYPEQVQIVFRHNPLPFHSHAMVAAQVAHEAWVQGGDPMFLRMHNLLFENQSALERPDLINYATTIGMHVAALEQALDDDRHQERIRADQAMAAAVGARGAPAFFINGRSLMGAQPYERFREIITEEIALATFELTNGVRRQELYARRMQNAVERRSEAPAPSQSPSPSPRPQPDPAAIYRIPVNARPSLGSRRALVTIVQFSEFQCPFCSRVQPTIEQIRQQYGADVRFVFRHNPLPFHDNAMAAANASEEVFRQRGGRAFFRYAELLFENQRNLTRETLVQLASRVGADPRTVGRAIDNDTHRAVIEADQQLANSVGARGTPAFFINGRNLRGAQPFPAFEAVIDEERARAQALLRSGTSRRRLYDALIQNGATSPQTIPGAAAAPSAAPDPVRRYQVAIPPGAPTRGPANARVTIQIFSDFQCPFCNRVRPTLDRIFEHYGNEVRLVWRDYPLPFHQQARPAAEAAREVHRIGGDRAFWRFHDLLFENQRSLGEDEIVRLAGTVPGISGPRVRRAITSRRHEALVAADTSAAQNAGMQIGTPSFLVGDRFLQGSQPFAAFQTAIDAAIRDSGGTPP